MERDERLENKIDVISDRISNIDVTLGKQAVILEEHVRRTDLLEKAMKPVENHVHAVHTILKLLGFVAVIATILEVIIDMVFKL